MQWLVILFVMFTTTNGFQPAQFILSTSGNLFEPINSVELLSSSSNINRIASYAMLCYRNSQCRTFDFDSISHQCRLFEGSVDTGTLLSSLSTNVVGWLNMNPSLFNLYGASSDQCVNNCLLYSNISSGLCECQIHTFWNGSMCVNQKFSGDACVDNSWCRTDLGINCTMMICVGQLYFLENSIDATVFTFF
jgi:hypothetical protein